MGYHLKETNGTFDIIEKETDTTISLTTSEQRARDLCRKLNLGSGFDGWTPTFFAEFKGMLTDEAA